MKRAVEKALLGVLLSVVVFATKTDLLAAPGEDQLKAGVELRQRGVAAGQKSAPDERVHVSHHNTGLIHGGEYAGLPRRAS